VGLAHWACVLGAAVPVVSFAVWKPERTRSSFLLLVNALTGLSAVGVLVVWAAYSVPSTDWRLPLSAAVSIVGGVVMLCVLVASKPDPDRGGWAPWSINVARSKRYWVARSKVLDILVERGLADVDEDQRTEMLNAPLGGWDRFDEPVQRP